MDEIFRVVGYQWGKFKDRKSGEIVTYCNLFCIGEFSGEQGEDRHFNGSKAVKLKCVDHSLFADVKPGDYVEFSYDRGGSVKEIIKTSPPAK